MSKLIRCDLCGHAVAPHESYVVRIEVFADPSMAPIDTTATTASETSASIADVMNELAKLSADELQDQVHRHFEHHLCAACHRVYLANPLGKPRNPRTGFN